MTNDFFAMALLLQPLFTAMAFTRPAKLSRDTEVPFAFIPFSTVGVLPSVV